ncbi:hypothetical protein BgiBS90_003386, partial [Biomphalaria glabrata]
MARLPDDIEVLGHMARLPDDIKVLGPHGQITRRYQSFGDTWPDYLTISKLWSHMA